MFQAKTIIWHLSSWSLGGSILAKDIWLASGRTQVSGPQATSCSFRPHWLTSSLPCQLYLLPRFRGHSFQTIPEISLTHSGSCLLLTALLLPELSFCTQSYLFQGWLQVLLPVQCLPQTKLNSLFSDLQQRLPAPLIPALDYMLPCNSKHFTAEWSSLLHVEEGKEGWKMKTHH